MLFEKTALRIILIYTTPFCNARNSALLRKAILALLHKAMSDYCCCDGPSLVLWDFNLADIEWIPDAMMLPSIVLSLKIGESLLDLVFCNCVIIPPSISGQCWSSRQQAECCAEDRLRKRGGIGLEQVATALEQLHADKKTPLFLKTLISHMFSVQKQLCTVLAKNQELQDQISCLREENMALKSALAEAGKTTANVMLLVEEKERQRSVVISGIPESKDPKSTERALHYLDFVKSILNHLEIECIPQITYRLGKPQVDRSRLVKVLLPNKFYKSLIFRRALRLRSFHVSFYCHWIGEGSLRDTIPLMTNTSSSYLYCIDAFKSSCFKASSDRFDRFLNRYHKYVERKIFERSKKTSLYTSLNSVRPERIPPLKDPAGLSAVSDKSKASMLAKHFQKSFSVSLPNNDALDTVSPVHSMECSIWFYKEEIYEALSSLPATFTVTPDEVPPYFIQKISHSDIVPIGAHI
ncbi:unnamed protein product [Heligmosomoides polygyrus]|uniref:UV radiation resistance associated protein n=1 Tax=Heligmosomoides polygyrus TaxID=6339 RepID=A0A183GF79_HELPZ|nr:unnamed protein product [Heligmosomoides polygyrus]